MKYLFLLGPLDRKSVFVTNGKNTYTHIHTRPNGKKKMREYVKETFFKDGEYYSFFIYKNKLEEGLSFIKKRLERRTYLFED